MAHEITGELYLAVQVLSSAYELFLSLPSTYLLIGHCCYIASLAPDFKNRYMVHYWLTYMAGFGGGIVSALLIMRPDKAGIALFTDNRVGIIWTLCWWAMNYAPGNLVGDLHERYWPIKMVTKSCTTLLRAQLIFARINVANELFPGVIAAALVLGTLAASGGKLCYDTIRHGWGALPGPAELTMPGFSLTSGVLAAAAYYVLAYLLRVLSPQEAAGLVMLLLFGQVVGSDVTGRPLDIFQPVFRGMHKITNIPHPELSLSKKHKSNNSAVSTPATVKDAIGSPAANTRRRQAMKTQDKEL